jgi:hypothetical protein
LFIVRLWDTFDGYSIDVSSRVSKEEADALLNEKTKNGTEYTKYDDGACYAIFPADTTMLWRPGHSYMGMDEDEQPGWDTKEA